MTCWLRPWVRALSINTVQTVIGGLALVSAWGAGQQPEHASRWVVGGLLVMIALAAFTWTLHTAWAQGWGVLSRQAVLDPALLQALDAHPGAQGALARCLAKNRRWRRRDLDRALRVASGRSSVEAAWIDPGVELHRGPSEHRYYHQALGQARLIARARAHARA